MMQRWEPSADMPICQVRAYEPGILWIQEAAYREPVLLLKDRVLPWACPLLEQLSNADWEPVVALKPDVVLLGTGATHLWLRPELYADLINAGIGVEVMSTRAACRTFNALVLEDRHVAAVLFL